MLPIDSNLKYEIDTSSTDVDTNVLVNITSGKVRLLFEMPFSQQTNTFVSDLLRATEVIGKYKGPPPEFSWLKQYKNQKDSSGTNATSPQSTDASKSISTANSWFYVSDTSSPAAATTDVHLGNVSNNSNDLEKSPELNRQGIAMGVSPTPIAARERHIKHQMALREDSYTDIQNVSVFVGTWNVNGQLPTVGLAEWLSNDFDPPDIYAIGFQELDLNTETFLFNQTPREQDWLNAVLNGIHPKARYKKVSLVRLVGMMLVILVQEKHFAYISKIATDTVGTGLMNKMGNKGAVSVRFDLHSTSICFVNAHMAAHVEEYERRNEDHDCILARTVFNVNITGPPRSIEDHDHIFFFGDMNYRIFPGDYNIKESASNGQYKILIENDQLLNQKNKKRIFRNFKEGDITFKPTFKYDLYTDDWDSSEKARLPAWCDRILWCGENIKQDCYRSHPALNISDHKPVSAVFTSGVKVIDSRRHRKVYEDVMKKLDKLENEFLPQVTVDQTEIIFDTVRFLQPQIKSLTIANTGQVPVDFAFIKKLNDKAYCKPWLSISPCDHLITPGDKCDVTLEVLVDKKTAANLNSGNDQLYDILVLHLDRGKDIFITITGNYERSSFGASINALVHMNKPFRDVPVAKLIDLESNFPKEYNEVPYAIPKELFYLVGHLHSHGMQKEGLFTISGLKKEIMEIRACLDNGVPDDHLPGSVYSVAEALMLFLEALAEPVIPFNMYNQCLEATPNFQLSKEVVNSLPIYHRNVFNYLMDFLKELLTHSEDNKLDAKTLGK